MRGWRNVGLVSGWQLAASVCYYAVFATTAFLRGAFGVSRALIGVAVAAVLLGYTVFLFPTGALVDGYGERRVMAGGLLVLAAGTAVVAAAPTFPLVVAALFVLGAAYAPAMPGTNRAVVAVAPVDHRNLAMNVKQVGVTAGSGLSAVLITAAAATRFGWRGGFLAAGVFATLVAGVFWLGYPARTGSGVIASPEINAMLDLRGFPALLGAGLFFGTAIFVASGYVVLHMTESVAASAGFAGLVLALVQVTGSAGRLGGGALADRLPGTDARANAGVLLGQGALATVCFLALAWLATPLAAAAAFLGVGLFVFGFPGVYYGCMTAVVPDDEVGAASAVGQLAINVGGLLGPPAFGLLVDAYSYGAGWVALAAVSVVATGLAARVATTVE